VVITEGNPETDVPAGDDAAIDGSPVDGAADAGAETSPETSAEA
jgi:hypothetical protein